MTVKAGGGLAAAGRSSRRGGAVQSVPASAAHPAPCMPPKKNAQTRGRALRHRARVLSAARALNSLQTLIPCAAFFSDCYLAGVSGLLAEARALQAVLLVIQLAWPFPLMCFLPALLLAIYLDGLAPWTFWLAQLLNACTMVLLILTILPPIYEFSSLYHRLREGGTEHAWELAFINTHAGLSAFLLASYAVVNVATTTLAYVIRHWSSEHREAAERAKALKAIQAADRRDNPSWYPSSGRGASSPSRGGSTARPAEEL